MDVHKDVFLLLNFALNKNKTTESVLCKVNTTCRPGHSRVCTVSADRAVSNTGSHQFYFLCGRFFHILPPAVQDSVYTPSGACSRELPRPCTGGDTLICTLCSCLLILIYWPRSMSYKGTCRLRKKFR